MTTQGGGWTLGIKYDFNQATTGNYALQNAGGVTYTNQSIKYFFSKRISL